MYTATDVKFSESIHITVNLIAGCENVLGEYVFEAKSKVMIRAIESGNYVVPMKILPDGYKFYSLECIGGGLHDISLSLLLEEAYHISLSV